ncbi:hypothetical protein ANCDUO_16493 [Ancylostoma duodenale]|uniref:Uncharacterized protein n=1 Tax=Ancylostoma duodenale TaxID=51022 RepID=A0A0C2CUB7_9BILA|nr:hypothetical protein ANCDUO_16493 [Ancylostoma duodenale]
MKSGDVHESHHTSVIRGYTPYGSRSRSEIAIYNEYFSTNRDPIMVFAFVVAKDGGSMARLDHMRETIRQLDYAGTNVTHRGKSFYTLCTDFCLINEPVRQFYTTESCWHQPIYPSAFLQTIPVENIHVDIETTPV